MTNEAENRIPLDDLLVFHQLARSLASSSDLDTILRTILEHMERTIHAELWTLLILDHQTQELYYALAAGGGHEALSGLRVKVGEGVAGWVAEHGETLIVPEAAKDSRLSGQSADKPSGLRSVIAMPLRGRRGTHGVIEIFNPTSEQLNDYTIAFLHILADHAAIALENADDMARIQTLSITDDCTGLFNARHLYDALAGQLDRWRNQAFPVSILFLDLDQFKLVNDEHGHLVGSELLARIGRRLRELCRSVDICFRYGGDEFVVMLPGCGVREAGTQARALLCALMETKFDLPGGVALTVSASVGVATAPADGTTVHAIIGCADSRMYAVKSAGRGAVWSSQSR